MRISVLVARAEDSAIAALAKAQPVVTSGYVRTKVRTAQALRTMATKLDAQRKLAHHA